MCKCVEINDLCHMLFRYLIAVSTVKSTRSGSLEKFLANHFSEHILWVEFYCKQSCLGKGN